MSCRSVAKQIEELLWEYAPTVEKAHKTRTYYLTFAASAEGIIVRVSDHAPSRGRFDYAGERLIDVRVKSGGLLSHEEVAAQAVNEFRKRVRLLTDAKATDW